MAQQAPDEIRRKLENYGQGHVFAHWTELTPPARAKFVEQLRNLDLDQLASLVEAARGNKQKAAGEDALQGPAARAVPPSPLIRLPGTAEERSQQERARQQGEELLRAGKVGAILVAGGQGTRLGFEKPKGVFPIGPQSGASLFEILAEQVLARSRRAGRPIPYFIMTSDATHDETVPVFSQHNFSGLPRGDIYFFSQGNMPAVDAASGKLLLSADKMLFTSPDGHGGILAALAKAGLLSEMGRRGIEYLHYHQVDNPTAIVFDPVFLGFHAAFDAEMSVKVVAKRSAEERAGVAVNLDGKTHIIEYSDLPPRAARKTDPDGSLLLWAGSTAIHVFSRRFIERVVQSRTALPYHVARKKVPYLDRDGRLANPVTENAYKFERFVFDALPLAERTLVLETDRAREFNPVKNAEGEDSPQVVRLALGRLHRGWLKEAGAQVDEGVGVEISPLFALDADEVRTKIKPGTRFSEPTFLH